MKTSQALKNGPRHEKSQAIDMQRKEYNWEQIHQKLRQQRGMEEAGRPELSKSAEHGAQHRTIKLLPIIRTGVAVVVGLGVVAYITYTFVGPGVKPTEAHKKVKVAVHQQPNLPAGATVTNLPSPAINPGNVPQGNMSDISPDGDWMIVQQSGGHPVLRSISGQTKITLPSGDIKIYGQTPDESLILGVVAGGIIGRFNPATLSITKLPSSADSSAHWTYAVAESVTGHWAMTVAKSNSATNHGWVNVDGYKVSSLQSTSRYAWSPAGNMLAAIVSSSHSGAMTSSTVITDKLVLYNATTGRTETPKATVLSHTSGKTRMGNMFCASFGATSMG